MSKKQEPLVKITVDGEYPHDRHWAEYFVRVAEDAGYRVETKHANIFLIYERETTA